MIWLILESPKSWKIDFLRLPNSSFLLGVVALFVDLLFLLGEVLR